MTATATALAPPLSPNMRRILDAPRGRRFNRPATQPPARSAFRSETTSPPPLVSLGRTVRERELLAQMPDTPRLRHRLTHGVLPEWMTNSEPKGPRPHKVPDPDRPSRPAPEQDDGPEPDSLPIPRPRRERTPPPPLPRRSDRTRRPASHRKPRRRGRRTGWLLGGYTLAVTAGALGQYLAGLLG